MLKRITIPVLLIVLLMGSLARAQVKIGDNPQVIDPSSILELESSERVLVITRVDSVQMTQIVPNRGAMVYNTTADCVFYYDGTRWVNLCGAGGNPITADPIVNDISTIVITPTENGDNLEIAPNSIQSEQIVNGGVNGIDIQDGSIGPGKLQDNSVTQDKLSENSVGAFALDNDNIDLSDFNNSTGFIRSADVISGDANNAITAGSDSGAFYDDTGILAQIDTNTSAIAADGDTDSGNEIQNLNLSGNLLTISSGNTVTLPSADGSDTNINAGANITITGNGTAATPYVIAADDEVDGSITNELTDLDFDTGTNILSLTNGATVAGSSVDLSTLAGGAGTTELSDGTTILGTGTPADRFRIAPGAADQFLTTDGSNNVVWSTVTPGGGDDDQTAAEVPVTATPVNYTAATQDVEAHLAGIDAALATGGGGNQNLSQVLTEGNNAGAAQIVNLADPTLAQDAATKAYVDANIGGNQNLGQVLTVGSSAGNLQINDLLDPTLAQDAATKGYVDATVAAGGSITDGSILIGGTGDVAQEVQVSGDALLDNTGVLTIVDNAIDTDNILDGTIGLVDLNDMGATADGDIINWNTTAGAWEVGPNVGHTGAANSLFFAAADGTGGPITTETSPQTNDDGGLYWNPAARFNSGALYIGLKTGVPGESDSPVGNNSKVVIAERVEAAGPGAGLAFPLQIQNEVGGNSPSNFGVGVLFSVEDLGAFGKGGLVYERQGAWAVGDFHFLQNTAANNSIPTLADKAFTVKNNGDIQLYGGIDVDGTPTGLGNAGQVLTSTGTGVQWGAAGGGGTDDQNLTLTGNVLEIEDGNSVDFTLILGAAGSDDQQLTLAAGNQLTLEDGGTVDLTPFLDDQTSAQVSYDNTGSGLTATDAQAAIDELASSGGSDDQQLTLAAGNQLTLEDGGTVDLTPFLDDQTSAEVSYDNTGSGLTATDAQAAIDELAASGGSDDQQLTLAAGNQLTLEDGGTVDLTPFLDDQTSAQVSYDNTGSGLTATDAQAAIDELAASGGSDDQQLTLAAGNQLTLEDGGAVDLTPFLDDQTSAEVSYDNTGSGLTATDAQAAIDELAASGGSDDQQLTLAAGNQLTLEDGGTVDLTPFLDDQTSAQVSYDNTGSGLTATDAQAAIDELASTSGGQNLSTTNLTQQAGQDRTYDLNGQELYFAGIGNIGVGTTNPQNKFHVAGEVRSEGFNSTFGTETAPSYSFAESGTEDSNTGIYRPGADQMGFSTGGIEILRLSESVGNGLEIIATGRLELESALIDINNSAGTVGQVLTSNGSQTVWADPTAGPITTNLSTFVGDGTAGSPLNINNQGITNGMIEDDAVDTDKIAVGAVETSDIANETIINEDIRGSAGIEGTKIDPNFGFQDILTTGNIDGNEITATGNLITTGGSIFKGAVDQHPDYVFQKFYLGSSDIKKNYKFASLQEIEAFVKKYYHLPGIKSAAQVKEEGVWDLGASNLQNLEKIEELFLHTINQEKEINNLKSENKALSSELEAIKKDLAEIKALLNK